MILVERTLIINALTAKVSESFSPARGGFGRHFPPRPLKSTASVNLTHGTSGSNLALPAYESLSTSVTRRRTGL
jgi:hypothetical protein